MKLFGFIVLFVWNCQVFGQELLFDSLEQELLKPNLPDTSRVYILNILSRDYIYVTSTRSFEYAQKALDKSIEINYPRGQAYAYRNLAANYSMQEYFFASYELMVKAIHIFENIQDSVGLANCYMTIGHTYKRQFDYKKAIEYHSNAARILGKWDKPERYAMSVFNLGESQMLARDLSAAKGNVEKAISMFSVEDHKPILTACYKVLGIIAYREGDLKAAEKNFEQALALTKSLGINSQKEATAESYLYLARIAQHKSQPEKELEYIEKTITIASLNHYSRFLKDAYLAKIELLMRKRDFVKVRNALQEYSRLDDSLMLLRSRDKAAMLEPVISTFKTTARNQQLQKQHDIQEAVISTQRVKNFIYVFVIILLIIIFFLLLRSFQQRRKYTNELVEQKRIIEEKSRKLEELNATKDKFFSIVSHDLKSPLNSLKSFIGLIHDNIDNLSKEEIHALVLQLEDNLDNTMNLANNLIVWAKSQMKNTGIKAVNVNIREVIRNVTDLLHEDTAQKEIKLDIEAPENIFLNADVDHIQFILRNLISNAIKFTPREGSIKVRAKDMTQTVMIEVEDTGIGIKPATLNNLFKAGKVTSTAGTNGESGTGIGLMLVKEFVEKNNGSITVESSLQRGTTFRLTFPKQ